MIELAGALSYNTARHAVLMNGTVLYTLSAMVCQLYWQVYVNMGFRRQLSHWNAQPLVKGGGSGGGGSHHHASATANTAARSTSVEAWTDERLEALPLERNWEDDNVNITGDTLAPVRSGGKWWQWRRRR
jgi:hypothetical protein